MSLLQEARTGIQRKKIEAEETRRKHEEYHRRHVEEEKTGLERKNAIRIEEEKRENLQSQVRSQCVELLRQYGTPEIGNVLSKAKAIWKGQRKELKTTIEENGEEPVKIFIKSEMLAPEKEKITVHAQGMDTFLELPKTGYGYLYAFDRGSGKSASREDLTEYQCVLSLVKAKLKSSVPILAHR